MAAVQLGIDNLLASQPDWLRSARIGLLANQASVDNRLHHTQNRLLEAGANPNVSDFKNKTPLDRAIWENHHDVIELLKQFGAKTNEELDKGGQAKS